MRAGDVHSTVMQVIVPALWAVALREITTSPRNPLRQPQRGLARRFSRSLLDTRVDLSTIFAILGTIPSCLSACPLMKTLTAVLARADAAWRAASPQ
jgi:hypothetical protein